ncbi:MAG: hypothetical protein U1C57_04100, partial [Candidatus Doudnabacteria bacterium]|nr:hypothetical protein [Candidatus Doudnabacteria bacterium]
WPLVQSMRNLVRSYGEKYYYSFKQNVPDEEIELYIKAVYKYIRVIFEQFNPDLILSPNFVALPFIMMNLYAARRNVKMIAVTDAKIKGMFMFSYSYRDDDGPLFTRLAELNIEKEESPNKERARQYIAEFRQKFKNPDHLNVQDKPISPYKTLRHELSPYYHSLLWLIKKPRHDLKNLGVIMDYRPPRIILRDHYMHKRYKRFAQNFSYFPFDRLRKFVYFPLQFQPEASIDVIAPYFSNQIETARLVAMALPDDYTLVAKDHPSMVGLHSPGYLEKIVRTPNVKLIDHRLGSEQILKKADLVVSPNSTTLAEAAFYNKPAIQLGDLGITLCLPNVFRHTDFTTLSSKIRDVLKIDLHTLEYERLLQNFVAAVYDTGFDFNYTKAWAKGLKGGGEELWQIYKKEIERNL